MKKELIIKFVGVIIGIIVAVLTALTESLSINTCVFVVLASALSVAGALGMSTLICPDVKFNVKTLAVSVVISLLLFIVIRLFI